MREMQREGIFKTPWSGLWWWKDPVTLKMTASVQIRTGEAMLWVAYESNAVKKVESFEICRIPCPFGGHRILICCPGCLARRTALYLRQARFRCRICHGLTYRTQSESQLGRLAIKRMKMCEKLALHDQRPKGMHLKRFQHIKNRIAVFEEAIDLFIEARMGMC